jgi:hypothetical protein
VDERRHARLGGGEEDAARAVHVGVPELLCVVGRLDLPREVDDAVGAAEVGEQVVRRDVGPGPLDLRQLEPREPPREAEHRAHLRLAGQRVQQARADVARRADDDHPHQVLTPSSSTSVKNAFA